MEFFFFFLKTPTKYLFVTIGLIAWTNKKSEKKKKKVIDSFQLRKNGKQIKEKIKKKVVVIGSKGKEKKN